MGSCRLSVQQVRLNIMSPLTCESFAFIPSVAPWTASSLISRMEMMI